MAFSRAACTIAVFSALSIKVCVSFAPVSSRGACTRGVFATSPVATWRMGTNSRHVAPKSFSLLSTQDDSADKLSAGQEAASSGEADQSSDDSLELTDEEKTIISRIKIMFKGNKDDEKLTTRQRLAKMGMSALLSYGFVSNMSYSVSVSLAWYGFSKKTGLSPLAPGQWKPFLAVYAGFYVFNNFVRPIRVALAAGVTKYFDATVNFIQRKTKFSRSASVGTVVFLANFCGTLAAMSFGIMLASIAAGVPVFPPKA